MGQGQIGVPNKGRWVHDNIKLLHLETWLQLILACQLSGPHCRDSNDQGVISLEELFTE